MNDAALAFIGVLIGGVIASVSSWLLAKQNHKTELRKVELEHLNAIKKLELEHKNSITKAESERRTKILTECAEGCYQHFAIAAEFFIGMRMANQNRNTPAWMDLLKVVEKDVERIKRSSFDLIGCESKLVLLGEKTCAEKLQKYIKLMGTIDMHMDRLQNEAVYQASYKQLGVLLEARAEFLEEVKLAYQGH